MFSFRETLVLKDCLLNFVLFDFMKCFARGQFECACLHFSALVRRSTFYVAEPVRKCVCTYLYINLKCRTAKRVQYVKVG